MWLQFIWTIVVTTLVLYVPGFLFLRGLRFSRTIAGIAAPVISTFAYAFLPVIIYELHATSNIVTVLFPTILISLGLYIIGSLLQSPKSPNMLSLPTYSSVPFARRTLSFERLMLLFYIITGTLVCCYVFVSALGSPEAFISKWDNQTHLNMTRAFIDYGNWSTVHASSYAAYAPNEMATVPSTNYFNYYPAAWHCIAALVCLLTDSSIPTTFNALTFVTTAIIGPLGIFLLHTVVFSQRKDVVAAGAVTGVCFAAFPWGLLIKGGPFYPNLFGFELMICALATMLLFVKIQAYRKAPIRFALFALAALLALGFTHPSTIFTAFVFFAAYVGHILWHALLKHEMTDAPPRIKAAAFGLAYCTAILIVWVGLLHVPLFDEVVHYPYYKTVSLTHGLINTFSLGVMFINHQLILAAIVALGAVICIKEKRYWILAPAAIMALAFLSARTGIRPLQWFLAGFWYQTPYRVAPSYIFFLIPIASIGLSFIFKNISARVTKHSQKHTWITKRGATALCLILFIALTFMPSFHIPGTEKQMKMAFSQMRNTYYSLYNINVNHVYNAAEVDFVNRVITTIPEGSLVLNHSQDGSTFAYGINDLKVYYQRCNMSWLTDDAILIWTNLINYADDEQIKKAIRKSGAEYLILLDYGVSYEDGTWMSQYNHPEDWVGISEIMDETPGFTIVLAEDDMRLYRLDAL